MLQADCNSLPLGIALLLISPAAWGAGGAQPGAYCPIPRPGEAPGCLEPARQVYGGLFAELAEGAPSEETLSPLEADLALGAGSERSYLALSSLAYGYYLLARRAAAAPDADPALRTRLERWNGLLARAYAESDDPAYRSAVEAAARDVHRRSPALGLACVDAQGRPSRCQSTEAVLRGFDRASGEVGVRASLRRLLLRLIGREGP